MVTSLTALCFRRVLQRARLACRCSVDAACALHRELACILEPEVKRWHQLVHQKGHTAGLLLV